MIVNAAQRGPCDMERGAAVSRKAFDAGAHLGERFDDALHGPFLNRCVPGERDVKFLRRQNAGDQARGGAAVAAVENLCRFFESAQAVPVDEYQILFLFNGNPHFRKARDGG